MKREIEGTEKATSIIGHWAPADLAYIEQIDFRAVVEDVSCLTIVGLFQHRNSNAWPDINSPLYRVKIRFYGVNGLRLDGFGGGCVQIMGFDIHSIANTGWENVLFEVEDYEDGRIGFTCSRVQLLEVEEDEVYL